MNMEKKSGIYMWTSPSGKSYIGQSVDLQKRKYAFLRFGDIYGGQKINCARKKYRHKSLWNYTILEYCDIDKLNECERYYIELYDTINNGYNVLRNGIDSYPRLKPVFCITTNIKYDSIKDAAIENNCLPTQIIENCKGKRGPVKGL